MIKINKKQLEKWLNIMNFWADYIEELSYTYPRTAKKYEKFNEIIAEIYDLTKGE